MDRKRRATGEPTAERNRAAGEVLNGFRRILRALRITAGETQASVGLSAAQLFVLGQLAHADVLSINELAMRTLTDRSSVAAVVERLVERGLIARSRAADDRRRAAIHITPAGRRLLRSAPAAPTERLITGLAALHPAELNQFARLMSRLVDAMGLEAAPATMLFEGEQPGGNRRARSEAS
jgi:DNA-binding MarR family transcriptional regulator